MCGCCHNLQYTSVIQSLHQSLSDLISAPFLFFFNPELPKGPFVYKHSEKSIVGWWTCDFCIYLCGARVNEPQQIARKDIIMSAHAPPRFKTKAAFFTPVKDKCLQHLLLPRISSHRLYSAFLSDTISIWSLYRFSVEG